VSEPRPLSREEVVERLATLIRDEAYPEFSAAPPPEWASRAAAKVIDFHQPMLRDTLLDAAREQAATEARRELLAAVEGLRPETPQDRDVMPMTAGYCDAIDAVLALLAPSEKGARG